MRPRLSRQFLVIALLAFAACGAPAAAGETVLLDFYSDACPPCREMAPVVDSLIREGRPVQKINVNQRPDLARRYGVKAWPTFLMLVDGQEIGREVGMTSRGRLEHLLARGEQAAPVVADVPASHPSTSFPANQPRDPFADAGGGWRGSVAQRDARRATESAAEAYGDRSFPETSDPVRPTGLDQRHPADSPRAADRDPLGGYHAAVRRALAATVRLKVTDPGGASFGSGTLIDRHGDEALILTCAHIFRESGGRGQIGVDLFDGERPRTVSGRLLKMDLERDVALVIIPAAAIPSPVPVANEGLDPGRGDRVFSVGCDRGMRPSVQESRVTMRNRFLGPANIEIAGQPVDGRSGGGLFDAEGRLVGVCNGQNPQDDEGVFAALELVQRQLDNVGLAAVYRGPNDFPGRPAGPAESVATGRVPEASREGIDRAAPATFALSPEERHLVELLRRVDRRTGAVCVLPPSGSPHAGRMYVIEQPSPRMLDELARSSYTAGDPAETADEVRLAGDVGARQGW